MINTPIPLITRTQLTLIVINVISSARARRPSDIFHFVDIGPSTRYDLSPLSDYERDAWERVQRWRHEQSDHHSHLPVAVREGAQHAADLAKRSWNAVPGTDKFDAILGEVLSGGYQSLADAVAASLQRERILEAARDAGRTVNDLADLRTLDLREIDAILPSLNVRYAATSAMTGAASGFVAGGGTAAIVGTAGVATAPGALAVVSALAGDVVATIALAARVVTHYAGYYGYDTREEAEKAVLLAVIGAGSLAKGASKEAALLQVRQVAMMVARRASWKELGEEAIVKLIQRLFASLSARLTKEKLAQALPVAGIALGSTLNYALIRKVGTTASMVYRERFLIEKYSLDRNEADPKISDVIDIESLDTPSPAETPDDEERDGPATPG